MGTVDTKRKPTEAKPRTYYAWPKGEAPKPSSDTNAKETNGGPEKAGEAKAAENRKAAQEAEARRDDYEPTQGAVPPAPTMGRRQPHPTTRDVRQHLQQSEGRVLCYDCHPTKSPSPSLGDLDLRRFNQELRKEREAGELRDIDRTFARQAEGKSPEHRAALARAQGDVLAEDPRPHVRAHERTLLQNEVRRLEREASTAAPETGEQLQELRQDLNRRPISPETEAILQQLEQTPAEKLSHRDAKAALEIIRKHKPLDSNEYDPRTGIKPGSEIFYTRAEQAALVPPEPGMLRQKAPAVSCFDCHPERPDQRFTLQRRVPGSIRVEDILGKPDHAALEADERAAERARLRADLTSGDPARRLKVPADSLTSAQKRELEDAVAHHRLSQLENRIKPQFQALDREYVRNGWSEDSPFYGTHREAFLKDVNDRPLDQVSHYDKFRALSEIGSFKRDHPEIFERRQDSFDSFRTRADLYRPKPTEPPATPPLGSPRGTVKCADCHPERETPAFELGADFARFYRPEWHGPPPTSELYFRDDAEMKEAGLSAQERSDRRAAIAADPANPIAYLKRPMSELSPEDHEKVSQDYTRYAINGMERRLRNSLVESVGREVDRLDRHFDRILADQGIVGDAADAIKNTIGRKDGWLIDSEAGSDAVTRSIRDAYFARHELRSLEDFNGSTEDFAEAFQARTERLRKEIAEIPPHIQKFQRSQSAWVDGLSDFASVTIALGAAALAPVSGGASLLVGAAVGAAVKVGVKQVDAWTGSGDYQGSRALDTGFGALNGFSVGATSAASRNIAQRWLTSAALRSAKGDVSMLSRVGIYGTTALGEGAADGLIVGMGRGLIEGKSWAEAGEQGLRGSAFGAVLSPVFRGSTGGLRHLWKGKPIDVAAPHVVATYDQRLGAAIAELDGALQRWPDGRGAPKARARPEALRDDLQLARETLTNNPTTNAVAATDRILSDAAVTRMAASEFADLQKAVRPRRALTASEAQAFETAKKRYTTDQEMLRRSMGKAYQNVQRRLYESLRKAAGIEVKTLRAGRKEPFKLDPREEIRRTLGPGGGENRAYGELALARSNVRSLGATRSGGMDEPGGGSRYEGESRILEKRHGPGADRTADAEMHQHGTSRAFDSEIRLLGLAREALRDNPTAAGKLRIFTEWPPCQSCQRAMASFRRDHPNIELEVLHNPL